MDYDAIVIGRGVDGTVAVIRRTELGKKAVIIETNEIGEEHINHACVPSKILIDSAKIK